jgi:hypothetical protein
MWFILDYSDAFRNFHLFVKKKNVNMKEKNPKLGSYVKLNNLVVSQKNIFNNYFFIKNIIFIIIKQTKNNLYVFLKISFKINRYV